MKVVVLKEFGGPENLSLGDLPIPKVEPGTALIRCWRVGRSGRRQYHQGDTIQSDSTRRARSDVAGVVEAVGDGVTEFAPGDEVFGCVGGVRGLGGTIAEYAAPLKSIPVGVNL
jgi:NADPH:quinone reductase